MKQIAGLLDPDLRQSRNQVMVLELLNENLPIALLKTMVSTNPYALFVAYLRLCGLFFAGNCLKPATGPTEAESQPDRGLGFARRARFDNGWPNPAAGSGIRSHVGCP